jgi:hypothetical protein
VQENNNPNGRWQGMLMDWRDTTLQTSTATVLGIGPNYAGFQVRADGCVIGPKFLTALYDQKNRDFLSILDDSGSEARVQLMGIWKDQGGSAAVTSDARAKHDIESLDGRYDIFFDNLSAQRFRYNVGTSDRYHTGYITQGVQEALVTAGIPEKEFAGILTFNQGTEEEESALRYYEFVSLNTDQIQKLKKRVDALEAKNVELEVKNAELEARLAKIEALLNNNAE